MSTFSEAAILNATSAALSELSEKVDRDKYRRVSLIVESVYGFWGEYFDILYYA